MKLYSPTATDFTNNGLGTLVDAVSCLVNQKINGEYELTMKYPVTGQHYEDIGLRSIVTAKVDAVSDDQPFRIYRITKPLNGIVTIYARHIAYDMSGIVISPYEADSLGLALSGIKTNATTDCPFNFETDKAVASPFKISTPKNLWMMLGGSEGSILDRYKGEWEFDGYKAKLWNRRGSNRGVAIRYGKNMTNVEQDANCSNVYTGVYPYWYNAETDTLVQLPERIIRAAGTYGFDRILSLDLTEFFESVPTEEQLRERGEAYIASNDIGVPTVSWKVEFVTLEQSEEYKGMRLLESIYLGDTVTVQFEKMGINARARAVEIQYNSLLERYESVTLGSIKNNFADTVLAQQKEITKKPSRTLVESIVNTLTDSILGTLGGSVRLIDTNNDGMPDELYIADNPDPAQAVKVWRFNYEGWAASSSGYNGPFTMGATLDSGLLATAITAAHLTAGTIQSADGASFYLNLDENILRMAALTTIENNVSSVDNRIDGMEESVDERISEVEGSVDTRINSVEQSVDTQLTNISSKVDDRVSAVEANVNAKLEPLSELTDYIQVGNLGTADNPLFGVKIGKAEWSNLFKSIFTAAALEFYEGNELTTFLSNRKLNTNTIRTAMLELVAQANMADPDSVDWQVTLDNGFTIRYVGAE